MVFLERPLNFHGFWTPRVYIYMSFLVMWLIGKVKKGLFQHLSLSTFHNWWLMISEGFVRRLSQSCWETETFRVSFLGLALNFEKKGRCFFFASPGCKGPKVETPGNPWHAAAFLLELPPWIPGFTAEMLRFRWDSRDAPQRDCTETEAEDFEENWKPKPWNARILPSELGVFCKLMIFLYLVFTVVLLQ